MTEEERSAWLARQMEQAPDRDETWFDQVDEVYLAGREEILRNPAA